MIAVGATVAFAAVGTAVILYGVKALLGLRVTEGEERMGLDLSQHNESADAFAPDYDESDVVPTSSHSAMYKTASPAKPENRFPPGVAGFSARLHIGNH